MTFIFSKAFRSQTATATILTRNREREPSGSNLGRNFDVLTEVLRCFPQFLHLILGRDLFLPHSFKIILHNLTILCYTVPVSNSSVMPRSYAVSGVDKVPSDLAVWRGANVQNDNICCVSLRTGFRYCDRRRYSGSLLRYWE